MGIFAFDTETYKIRPGLLAPKKVCLSWADAHSIGLHLAKDGVEWLRERFKNGDILVGLNIAFDMAVVAAFDLSLLPLIFEHYEKGLVRDVGLREQLDAISDGDLDWDRSVYPPVRRSYSLEALVKKYLGKDMDKGDDGWRLRYGELDGVPLDQWPQRAVDYAKTDARYTLDVFFQQAGGADIPDEQSQCRAAFVLHLMSVWGLRTDPEMVAALKAKLTQEIDEARAKLFETGIYRPPKKGKNGRVLKDEGKISKNMEILRARVVAAYEAQGRPVPRTDPTAKYPEGQIQTSDEVLTDSGDPLLALLAETTGLEKLLGTFVPILEQGVEVPINARFHPLVMSGRTSCSGPPLQQLPRKGGIRECFVPRKGYCYIDSDYDAAELRSLAEACLKLVGFSKLAEALNAGLDPHLDLAAEILGITYEEAKRRMDLDDDDPLHSEVVDKRQLCKAANFGFPGGMVADTFREYAKGYGVILSKEQAEEIHHHWKSKWTEMELYHKMIKQRIGMLGEFDLEQLVSGRIRGGCGFCDGSNSIFQGLTADGAKRALWYVSKACYVEKDSPLYGSRPVVFMHDEIMCEAPEEKASEAAEELARLMLKGMGEYVKSVKSTTSPCIMRRWYKGAKTVRDASGKIIPWEPKPKKTKVEELESKGALS